MISYYVPNFPVHKIHRTGEDGWVHIPNHPKNKYKWLNAVLELIDNTGVIDPVQIVINNENDVTSGPCGANRLHALMTIRKVEFVPALVTTDKYYDWFGEGVEEIKTKEDILKYFRKEHLPDECSLEDGRVYWRTNNVYDPQKIISNMMVSQKTKDRLLKMIEEEKRLGMI
jgi:hypothetical protein